jgi:hypothetical protein
MIARWPLPFVLVFDLTVTRAASPTITLDAASPAGQSLSKAIATLNRI